MHERNPPKDGQDVTVGRLAKSSQTIGSLLRIPQTGKACLKNDMSIGPKRNELIGGKKMLPPSSRTYKNDLLYWLNKYQVQLVLP